MNPKDQAYPELSALLSRFANSPSIGNGDELSKLMITCQGILKREWETLKDEVRTPLLEAQ